MWLTSSCVIILLLASFGEQQEFGELADLHLGCFLDNPDARDLERRLSGDLNSIDKCIEKCRENYYKYAGETNRNVP